VGQPDGKRPGRPVAAVRDDIRPCRVFVVGTIVRLSGRRRGAGHTPGRRDRAEPLARPTGAKGSVAEEVPACVGSLTATLSMAQAPARWHGRIGGNRRQMGRATGRIPVRRFGGG
jgi:hypothetical protein